MKPQNQPQPGPSETIQINEQIPNIHYSQWSNATKPSLKEYKRLNDEKILAFWEGLKDDYDRIHINNINDPKKREFIIKNIEFYKNKLK